jgi:hypothetical protein
MNPSYDDDLGPVDQPVQPQLGEAEVLLRDVIDLIATAPNVPLSSTPRIDREQVLALLDEAVARFPDEIRQARWMLKEREDFVNKTRREADEVLKSFWIDSVKLWPRVVSVCQSVSKHCTTIRTQAARSIAVVSLTKTIPERIRHGQSIACQCCRANPSSGFGKTDRRRRRCESLQF